MDGPTDSCSGVDDRRHAATLLPLGVESERPGVQKQIGAGSLRKSAPAIRIRTDQSEGIANVVHRILGARYGRAWERNFVDRAFRFTDRAYAGRHCGWLGCDTPYHDLQHALATALLFARMIDGRERVRDRGARPLAATTAASAIAVALMHDCGFLRRPHEKHIRGAALTAVHEARSIEFAREFLARSTLPQTAPLSQLIDATRLSGSPHNFVDPEQQLLAQMLGTADLVSQLADRRYIARVYCELYFEFVEAGIARGPDGRNSGARFQSAEQLVLETPAFYGEVVAPHLDGPLGGTRRFIGAHFGGLDPFQRAIDRNIQFALAVSKSGRFDLLRAHPETGGEAGLFARRGYGKNCRD